MIKCLKDTCKKIVATFNLIRINSKIDKNTVLLITHDFSLSGAPVVLMNMAKVLQEKGYSCVFLSPITGPLKKVLKRNGFDVIVTYDKLSNNDYRKLFDKVDNVIVNTIVNYKFIEVLEESNKSQNVVWWIHEGDYYLEKYLDKIKSICLNKTQIVAVSDYVLDKIKRYNLFKDQSLEMLPYYITDEIKNSYKNTEREYQIGIIGSICDRKNQIELIDAIDLLIKKHSNLKNKINLNIIGSSISDEYNNEMNRKLEEADIHYNLIESIPQEQMQDVYKTLQLLACPSKDDPLPVTVTEAMCKGIPVLCSNKVGQYNLLNTISTDLTYIQGNIEELSHKIFNLMFMSSDVIQLLSAKEMSTVMNYFTKEAFSKKLDQLIELNKE